MQYSKYLGSLFAQADVAATGTEDVSTEEEDTSPRSRAMSAFLARRKAAAGESAAAAAAVAVRAQRAPSRRPSLPTQQLVPAETGPLMPRSATDDGIPECSPPRVGVLILITLC